MINTIINQNESEYLEGSNPTERKIEKVLPNNEGSSKILPALLSADKTAQNKDPLLDVVSICDREGKQNSLIFNLMLTKNTVNQQGVILPDYIILPQNTLEPIDGKVFYPKPNHLTFSKSSAITLNQWVELHDTGEKQYSNIILPDELDTEFNNDNQLICEQWRPIHGKCLVYGTENKEYSYAVDNNSQFRGLQRLQQLGFEIEYLHTGVKDWITNKTIPTLEHWIYGFFLTVDYFRSYQPNSYLEDYIKNHYVLQSNLSDFQRKKQPRLNDKKKLEFSSVNTPGKNELMYLPVKLISPDGLVFRYAHKIVDTCSTHGVGVSYAAFRSNCNLESPFKDLYTRNLNKKVREFDLDNGFIFDYEEPEIVTQLGIDYHSSDKLFSNSTHYNSVEIFISDYLTIRGEDDKETTKNRRDFARKHLTGYGYCLFYGISDTGNHDALSAYTGQLENDIYDDLNLGEYFQENRLKLNFGSTVSSLYESSVSNKFDVANQAKKLGVDVKTLAKIVTKDLLAPASAKNLASEKFSDKKYDPTEGDFNSEFTEGQFQDYASGLLLRKQFGGRHFNNQPTHKLTIGVIPDTDYTQAYLKSMIPQTVGIGLQRFDSWDVEPNNTRFLFAKSAYEGKDKPYDLRYYNENIHPNVEPRLENLFVLHETPLPTNQEQSLFQTYTPPKDWFLVKTKLNSESIEDYFDEQDDFLNGSQNVSINTRKGNLVKFTTIDLEALEHLATPQQKKSYLDSKVVCAAYYHNDDYLEFDEFFERYWAFAEYRIKAKAISGCNAKIEKIKLYQEMRKAGISNPAKTHWTKVTMGELLVKALGDKRIWAKKQASEYKKLKELAKYDEYQALQLLFKLFGNTIYGVLASRFFETGNITAMNNVTAIVRFFCFILQQAKNGTQALTDGVAANDNRVITPIKRYGDDKQEFNLTHFNVDRFEAETVRETKPYGFKYTVLGHQLGWVKWEWYREIVCKGRASFATIEDTRKAPQCDISTKLEYWDKPDFIVGTKEIKYPQCDIYLYKQQLERDTKNNINTDYTYAEYGDYCTLFYPDDTRDGEYHEYVKYHDSILIKDHIKICFPQILKSELMSSIFDLLLFQSKGVYSHWITASKGDYLRIDPSQKTIDEQIKITKRGQDVKGRGKDLIANYYIINFSKDLIELPPSYEDRVIISVSEYRQRYNTFFSETNLKPGDSYEEVKTFNIYVPGQYIYQSSEQKGTRDKLHHKVQDKYGLSYEFYFIEGMINNNPIVNYSDMMYHVQRSLNQGFEDFKDYAKKEKLKAVRSFKPEKRVDIENSKLLISDRYKRIWQEKINSSTLKTTQNISPPIKTY